MSNLKSMKVCQTDHSAAPRMTATGRRWSFRQIGTVAYRAIVGWVEHNDANMGAALAFYTMFAIAPILVIAVALACRRM